MAVVLEQGPDLPAAAGARVAALVERSSGHHAARSGGGGWVLKRPLAILVSDSAGIRAFALSGAGMDLAEVERLCPGVLGRLNWR